MLIILFYSGMCLHQDLSNNCMQMIWVLNLIIPGHLVFAVFWWVNGPSYTVHVIVIWFWCAAEIPCLLFPISGCGGCDTPACICLAPSMFPHLSWNVVFATSVIIWSAANCNLWFRHLIPVRCQVHYHGDVPIQPWWLLDKVLTFLSVLFVWLRETCYNWLGSRCWALDNIWWKLSSQYSYY